MNADPAIQSFLSPWFALQNVQNAPFSSKCVNHSNDPFTCLSDPELPLILSAGNVSQHIAPLARFVDLYDKICVFIAQKIWSSDRKSGLSIENMVYRQNRFSIDTIWPNLRRQNYNKTRPKSVRRCSSQTYCHISMEPKIFDTKMCGYGIFVVKMG